jgi:haloalkane dehalogenase
MPAIELLDSFMNYRDTGAGDVPIVFMHGNPTSSYVWRNVIPHVAGEHRCLAPDLIGMGESGKPDIPYRFSDHVRYLDAWFDAIVGDEVVLVGHDWGGALAMDWGARHPDQTRGVAVIETFLRPVRSAELAPPVAEVFRNYRSAKGEEMVLEKNMVIEGNLVNGVVDGEPADVVDVITRYGDWMASSPTVPKLLMAVENGVGLGSPEVISWASQTFANVEVELIGPGGHQIPEDQPDNIGAAVADWLTRHTPKASQPIVS